MSEVSQGPGWWLASDGKWYSPEQAPGYTDPGYTAPGYTDPGYTAPGYTAPGAPPYSPPGTAYGLPPGTPYSPPGTAYSPPRDQYGYAPGLDPPGYGYPATGVPYGFTPVPKTNGLAIAAMVCSFFFWLYGVGAVLGIVFGFIARSQIKRSGGMQQGKGMALAGIIIGFTGIAIGIVLVIVLVVAVNHCQQNGTCTSTTFNSGS